MGVRSTTPGSISYHRAEPALYMGRQLIDTNARRVGAGGVQEGAAGPVDSPGVLAVQRQHELRIETVLEVGVGKTHPAAADANDLVVAGSGSAVDHRLDDGVETGNVAAAGEDPDALPSHWR